MSAVGDLPNKRSKILVLFDVDGTITPARQNIEDEMDSYLQKLKSRVYVGLVGGSDLSKIAEQSLLASKKTTCQDPIKECVEKYDYVFAENGLVAYEDGTLLAKQSIIDHLGEERLQKFINFCLEYLSNLKLPVKRGNFIEFRNGLINVCPVGRSCSQSERDQFHIYDDEHQIRKTFIEELKTRFGEQGQEPLGLAYSIGGQISIDAFPEGWDKTFCLQFVDKKFEEIHFFGDKTQPGGNDYEIYSDTRTVGHTVKNPLDTLEQLEKLGL